jgi:alpha-aminoadipic semialdehyde synthase
MNRIIGIRHEDKYAMERRVAITPKHAKRLIKDHNLKVLVEYSEKRIFKDSEYQKAGAQLTTDLSEASVIFGVKEMPSSFFDENKTYVFFSHVIKGQSYNMPMLRDMMTKKCNLIEYERIVDDDGRRLIFFGKFAGLAGMINSLWSLGQRLEKQGVNTPFSKLKQSHKYESLEEAKDDIRKVGEEITKNGLPQNICPLTIGFTGYGNVSKGAQEIVALLPLKKISPSELIELKSKGEFSSKFVYSTVFKEEHLSVPINEAEKFELNHYYNHPEKYKNDFEKYIPHISILMNCMYWDDRYPRIVTKDYLEKLYSSANAKLKVIGDVTCDPDGSIECTHIGTEIEDPVFVYNPLTREPSMGFEGEGILVMSVDILPSELPRESSISFGDALFNYIENIATADYNASFEELKLPAPIKKALVLHNGELTPDFEYIQQYL